MPTPRSIFGLASLSLAALLLFAQCSGDQNQNNNNNNNTTTSNTSPIATPNYAAVRPPIKGLDIPKTKHIINGAKGGTINIPSGTVITVAPNTFVDKDGKAINDDVEISYREMHDAIDVLVSGIPIHRPNGQFMETAGMFEINGHYQGQEIFVAKDKKINVNMASFNGGENFESGKAPNFDFWQLDPEKGSWTDIDGQPEGQSAYPGQPNPERDAEIARLKKQLPNRPVCPTNPKKIQNPVFDLEVNYSSFPELAPFKGIIWECVSDKASENPDKNEWVFDTEWSKVQLSRTNQDAYRLDLTAEGKKFSSLVRPILSEKDYAKAMAEFDKKLDESNDIIARVQKEIKRAEQTLAIQREIKISGFGIYNWDFMHEPGSMQADPFFTFNQQIEGAKENIDLYLIAPDRKAVVHLGSKTNANDLKAHIKYYNHWAYKVVAIIDNERLAVISESEFAQARNNNRLNSLVFNKPAKKINSMEDIRQMLNS